MKLARWQYSDDYFEGIISGEYLIPFIDGVGVLDALSMTADEREDLLERARRQNPGVARSLVRLLSPIRPHTLRDFSTFESHIEGMVAREGGGLSVPRPWYDHPTYYFSNPHTVIGVDESFQPAQTEQLDFELEVAAILGNPPDSTGNNTSEIVRNSIAGYTIMNDWTARDVQMREMKLKLGPSKGKDFATTLGPWIVTADELAPFQDADGRLHLRAEVWLNGQLIGQDSIANMAWTFPDLVFHSAQDSRVETGDVIASGSIGNGGCLAELAGRNPDSAAWLQPGDELRLVVEGLGEQRTRIEPFSQTKPRELPARPWSRR